MHAQNYPSITEDDSPLLLKIFANCSPAFFNVISQPEKYKYQIIYTRVDRNKKGRAGIETHYFNFNKKQYLYPASFVKLPLSILALQKMETLRKYGVTVNSPMLTDSAYNCQLPAWLDLSQPEQRPTLDGYIKKMMLVSDNDGYNRTYEFLGYDYINSSLAKHGYPNMRIIQRFEFPCDSLSYLYTNPVYFLNGSDTIYKQPMGMAKMRLRNPYGEVFMGRQYYVDGYLYPFPRAFYRNNFAPLNELHTQLLSVFLPGEVSGKNRFEVSEANMNLLKRYMGQWPRESSYPTYSLPDNYKKYIMMGEGYGRPANSDLRIFNVVSRAYGVIGDNAYIVDFKNGVEFFVSCILYTNESDILNSDLYEYDSVGLPFLGELGRLLYQYELQRPKKYPNYNPELKKLF